MNKILPYILSTITRTQRYNTEYKEIWNNRCIVHSLFRVYEFVFWRKIGIRVESSIQVKSNEDGTITATYKLYTLEALLGHFEMLVRLFVAQKLNLINRQLKFWKWEMSSLIPQFQLFIDDLFSPQFSIVGVGRVKATNRNPDGYLFAVAYNSIGDDLNASGSSFDGSSGSTRVMVGLFATSIGSDSVTAATYGTDSFTKKGSRQGAGGNRYASVWSLSPTLTGSQSITVTGGVSTLIDIILYTGCDTTLEPMRPSTFTSTV